MVTTQIATAVRERVGVHAGLPAPEMRLALRRNKGVPRRELARIVGTTEQTIGRWEHGTRTPKGILLDRYVAALAALAES